MFLGRAGNASVFVPGTELIFFFKILKMLWETEEFLLNFIEDSGNIPVWNMYIDNANNTKIEKHGANALCPTKIEVELIINPYNPDLCQEIEQFLSDSDIQIKNIPVTIIVNPPIKTVIENISILSEILIELLAAYRAEGNYFLELHKSPIGIVVAFGIEHTATSFTTEMGHC